MQFDELKQYLIVHPSEHYNDVAAIMEELYQAFKARLIEEQGDMIALRARVRELEMTMVEDQFD